MKKYPFILVVLLSVSLVLTSCGGSPTKLDITMTDYKFDPVENTIAAGQEITLKIANDGANSHEYVIMNLGQTVGEKFGDEDEANIFWEVEVEPGDSTTVKFTAPSEPGVYEIVCGTEGHVEQGMVGKLTVVAP